MGQLKGTYCRPSPAGSGRRGKGAFFRPHGPPFPTFDVAGILQEAHAGGRRLQVSMSQNSYFSSQAADSVSFLLLKPLGNSIFESSALQ